MNQRLFVIASSLLVLTVLAGVFLLFFLSEEKPVIIPEITKTGVQTSTEITTLYNAKQEALWNHQKNEADIMGRIVMSGTVTECGTLTFPEIKAECQDRITIRAVFQSGNSGACDTIKHTDRKRECLNGIVMRKAQKEGDITLCRGIDTPLLSSSCVSEIERKRYEGIHASGGVSMAQCLTFTDKAIRARCTRSIIQKEENTLLTKAMEGTDPSLCDELTQETNQSLCRNEVYFRVAMTEKDTSYCSRITDTKRSNLCDSNLLSARIQRIVQNALQNDDPTLCNELDTGRQVSCRESVFMSRVRKTRDPSLCGNLTTPYLIAACREITAR